VTDPIWLAISAGFSFATTVISLINNRIGYKTRGDVQKTRNSIQSMEDNANSFRDALVMAVGRDKYAEWIKAQHMVNWILT